MKQIKDNYQFELEFEVRDYECDIQGIVNNSVYQHYLEHTRHKFLHFMGLDFAELNKQGIVGVVARADIAYKDALRPADKFVCRANLVQEGIKFVFYQDIYRLADEKLCLKAKITTVNRVNGRLCVPEIMEKAVAKVAGSEKSIQSS